VFEAGEAKTGEYRGMLFIAMRYVPGGDVRALMRRSGPLPPGRAVWIISQVASALDAAHAAGLVHRDVKPANMLVDARAGRPDHVYLSDFGLSKGKLAASELTGAGQFLGTVDYISPEQIEGKPVDGRADEYALACAAFELLAGAPPFRRDGAMAVMYAQLSEPPPLVTSQRPDLPPAADQVFARALAKAPAQRYASCREFADALRVAFGVAPYDSGPGAILSPHPPIVGMSAVAAADMPTEERDVPAPARSGGHRRAVLATLSGASVLALTAITAAVIMASPPTHGSASSSTPAKAHPVTATPTAQQQVTVPPPTRHPATPAAALPVRPTSAPSPTLVVASSPPPTHPVTPSPAPTHSVAPTPSATPTYSAAPTPPPGY
jgi:serine/threonine-protein kinase